ncbi:MAG: hypothetical protein BGO41_10060 [Clostridiales bacterium 38-18]|nr:MAG: hypothetical protein BGO41_10060 [Clostridiales bacterium 38-18]
MSLKEVTLKFTNEFSGELVAPKGIVKIGTEEGTVLPYDMLLGALGSCLYSTFLDIMNKKRVPYDRAEIHIVGEKRTEVPTTLKWVKVDFKIVNPEKEVGIEQAVKLATEYCSIYQTISHVADMSYTFSIVTE